MQNNIIFKENGLLQCQNEVGEYVDVKIIDCFPLSDSANFLSLVNDAGIELQFIDDIDSLAPTARSAILKAQALNKFSFNIIDLYKVEEQQELRCYFVKTTYGDRKLFTKKDVWPLSQADGSIKFEDLFGDIYIIGDKKKLPLKARDILSYYVD